MSSRVLRSRLFLRSFRCFDDSKRRSYAYTNTRPLSVAVVGNSPPDPPTSTPDPPTPPDVRSATAVKPPSAVLRYLSITGELFKWKLSTWIALSTLPGFVMSAAISPLPFAATFTALAVGTFLCSGGANAFNQLLERDRDALMLRTRARPFPSGRVSIEGGLAIACLASVSGVGVLAVATNPLTAALGAANIGLYVLAYTPLKVRSPYNTHVGSVVGSIPPLMGCTAAGASLLTPDPWMLFIIQTLWQFPHFYGLAWRYRGDYIRGGFISFPLSDQSGVETAKMMKPYILATILFPLATTSFGLTNCMFLLDGSVANWFLWDSFRKFEKVPSAATSRKFFGVSLWHLLVLLTLFVFHSRCLKQGAQNHAGSGVRHAPHAIHGTIESLRDIVEDYCVHPHFTDRDVCVFDRLARLTTTKWSS